MTPRTFWILVSVIVVIFLCALAFIIWHGEASSPQTATSTPDFPITGSGGTGTGTGGDGNPSATGMTVADRGGNSVTTTDFIHNGVTIADPANAGMYYLAGGPGYCNPDGTCPSGAPASDFIVTYDSAQQAFNIALTQEPLGQARKDAEQFMLATLGVTQSGLCALRYYIGTDVYTNEQYAGINLGFSFCPDATALP